MDYFSMITANKMLKQGILPNVKSIGANIVAGFGYFNPLSEKFEYPIQVEKNGNKNVKIIPWEINNAEVVYEAKQKNGTSQVIHCNMTQLEFKVAPFIHLFCFHKINEKIKSNKIFQFFDDESGCAVSISPKEVYQEACNG